MRTGTDRFIAVYATRTNDPYGQLAFLHFPDLYIAGMGAQQPIGLLMNIEGILHVTRRVVFRQIEGCEIVPVIFNLRTICYRKSETLKYTYNAVAYQCDRMAG